MTDREKAIVMAYTGACMLTGDKFQIFHKYVEDIIGRPIWTHELGWLEKEIKEKSKADFIALCADTESEKGLHMLTYEENVRAVLECIFAGYKDELINAAVNKICTLKYSERR